MLLQESQGKGDEGWGKKSVFASFPCSQYCLCLKKNAFGAAYSMSNKFLIVARHTLTTGLQKCL